MTTLVAVIPSTIATRLRCRGCDTTRGPRPSAGPAPWSAGAEAVAFATAAWCGEVCKPMPGLSTAATNQRSNTWLAPPCTPSINHGRTHTLGGVPSLWPASGSNSPR